MIVTLNEQTFRVDLENPLDISIPLDFAGPQPNAYGVERAVSTPCEAGELVGDTRRGGSCNFEQVTFIPHCNGTHTECVGHITRERISVRECLKDAFVPAALVSIEPEKAGETNETYPVELNASEPLITRKSIEAALQSSEDQRSKIKDLNSIALIVRTMPNDESKKSRTYLEEIPPFFSTEAIEFIAARDFRHLLVDTPSIDRIYDEGKLSNHRIFWNVRPGAFETDRASRIENTVTELIFVPADIDDGNYLLNLQIAPFSADAAPSRPLLFRIL